MTQSFKTRISLQQRGQDALWKYMAKTCPVRLMSSGEYKDRKALLASAIERVNTGAYAPEPIHGFLSAPKGQSVARFIPVFTYIDNAIYFACMQHIDKKLAAAAVKQTFGAWQLGSARREIEEQDALELFAGEGCPSMPISCYNRAAWMQQWQEYWKLVAAKYEHADESAWFAMFDIANFYDSVDLHRLEANVRAVSGGDQLPINVLFHYILTSWNRALSQYAANAKGLPMDLVGDCSRLLANYFLTQFDTAFTQYVQSERGDFMRFADDMVVCGDTRSDCERFVFEASSRLHEIGLNVNVAKVKYCNKREFERFWGFVVMDLFESGDAADALLELGRVVEDDKFGRKTTAMKRAITVVDRQPAFKAWRRWVYETVTACDLPLHLSREQLLAYLRISDDLPLALDTVIWSFAQQRFTQPKAILLRVLERLSSHENREVRDLCSTGIREISALNDPVLKLAIKHIPN